MSEPSDKQLDDALQQWQSGLLADLSDATQLADRVMDKAVAAGPRPSGRSTTNGDRPEGQRPHATLPQASTSRAKQVCLVATLAALLAVAFGLGRYSARNESADLADLKQLAIPADADVDRHRQVFAEMQRVFGSQLRWVADVQDDMQLQVDDAFVGESKPQLLVRIVMPAQKTGLGPRVLEVLTHSEEKVRLAIGANGEALDLWAYVLPDGKVLVETNFVTNGRQLQTETLQAPGDATVVADLNGIQTGIVQSVTMLNREIM